MQLQFDERNSFLGARIVIPTENFVSEIGNLTLLFYGDGVILIILVHVPCMIGNIGFMMMTMAVFIPETHDSSRRIIRLSFSSCSVKTGGLCETHYPSKTT